MRVVIAYVVRIIEDGYYPHDTLVYNLLFFEGDTSGHVVDRSSLRMGCHPSLAEPSASQHDVREQPRCLGRTRGSKTCRSCS